MSNIPLRLRVDIPHPPDDNLPMFARYRLHGAILLLFLLQAGGAIPTHSVTIDEYAHVPAGYSYWRSGSMSLYHQNPPLVKLWNTLPFLVSTPLDGSALTSSQDPWMVGLSFYTANAGKYLRLINSARAMTAALGVLLCVAVYAWARRMFGRKEALVSMFLTAMCPNIIAHSQFATIDIGFTLAVVLSLGTFWWFVRHPTWGAAGAAGTALGIAQLTKFSAVLLYPVTLVLVIGGALGAAGGAGMRIRRYTAIILVSVAVLNAGYLFSGMGGDLSRHAPKSRMLRALAETSLRSLPLPLPAEYIRGFDAQMVEAEGGHIVFLNGTLSLTGWWYYYAEAFLLKTPLAFLVILLLGAMTAIPRGRARESYFLLFPAAAYFCAFSFGTRINIGLRYLLPVYPLLALWAGPRIAAWAGRRRFPAAGGALGATCLLFLCAIPSIVYFPHHLSYFNALAGGPNGGHRFLIDSNLDWGQDLPQLRRYMETYGIPEISLAYFGVASPEAYGIRYTPAPVRQPVRGYLAVSASLLQGKGEWYPGPDGRWRFLPEKSFEWLKNYQPVGKAGYSIFIYHLP